MRPPLPAVYQAERDGVGEPSIAQCRLNARERLGNGEAMQIPPRPRRPPRGQRSPERFPAGRGVARPGDPRGLPV